MITNKDISIDSENGKITLNGNKYDLGTQGEIDTAVKDVYSVMGQNGAKNLIPYPYSQSTYTANGITFTDNGDGTVTVNGTATDNTNFWCIRWEKDFIFPEGNYILSDGGAGNNGVHVFLANYNNSTWKRQYSVLNGEMAVTVQHSSDYNRTPIGITVNSGTTVNNLTFKPMLRLASDTDDTYQPYAKTNKQLTEVIGDLSQTGVTGATVAAQLSALNTTLTNKSEVKMLPLELSFSGGVADFTKSVVASDMDYPISVLSFGGRDFYLVSLQNESDGVFRVYDAKDPSASGNKELRIVYKTVN